MAKKQKELVRRAHVLVVNADDVVESGWNISIHGGENPFMDFFFFFFFFFLGSRGKILWSKFREFP